MNMIQIEAAIRSNLVTNIPTFLRGKPGLGKSDIVRAVAKSLSYGLLDVRAALLDPVDLRGIPANVDGRTVWLVPDFLPQVERDGAEGILFLDELTNATLSTQGALFQLVLDRRLGEYRLPDGWRIVAAGNRQSDKASAGKLSSALANRFMLLDCEADADAWCAWANANAIDPMIVAFIRFRPALLHSMDSVDSGAFPTPRSWANVSKVLAANPPRDLMFHMISGLVSQAAAAEFMGFMSVYSSLPSVAACLAAPDAAAMPHEISARYAIACAVSRAATVANASAAFAYLKRLPAEFCTMAILDAVKRDSALKETAAFVQWAIDNQKVTL